eukprot:gene15807-20947_t
MRRPARKDMSFAGRPIQAVRMQASDQGVLPPCPAMLETQYVAFTDRETPKPYPGAPMPHADSLISTLVGGFVLAFVFGMLANRLKLSPLVGYLVAGIVVGPHTAGFVADTTLAPQLAEIGVILLMFGVGLHFSPADLMKVRKVAIPGALVQIASATVLGW